MTNSRSDSCQILVVDDNPDAAFTLVMLLKLKGYDACARYSGREGVMTAEHLQPDVVILDLAMPEMDGYDACRIIRQQPRGKDLVMIAFFIFFCLRKYIVCFSTSCVSWCVFDKFIKSVNSWVADSCPAPRYD